MMQILNSYKLIWQKRKMLKVDCAIAIFKIPDTFFISIKRIKCEHASACSCQKCTKFPHTSNIPEYSPLSFTSYPVRNFVSHRTRSLQEVEKSGRAGRGMHFRRPLLE